MIYSIILPLNAHINKQLHLPVENSGGYSDFVQKHLTIAIACDKFLKNLFHISYMLKKLFL